MKPYEFWIRSIHEKVTSSSQSLREFIYDSAYTFRYKYEDRLILHEKAPGEIAFGSMEQFSKFLGRYIEKGGQRIYLSPKEDGSRPFVFPYSKTIKVDETKPDLDLFYYDLEDRPYFDILCEGYQVPIKKEQEIFVLEYIARNIANDLSLGFEQTNDFIDTFIIMLSKRMNINLPNNFFVDSLEKMRKYPYVKLKEILDFTANEVDVFIVTLENIKMEMEEERSLENERDKNGWKNMDRGEWILFAQNCQRLRRGKLLYQKGWISNTTSKKEIGFRREDYSQALGYLARFYSTQRGGTQYESKEEDFSIFRELGKTFRINEPGDIKRIVEKSGIGKVRSQSHLAADENPLSSKLRNQGESKDLSRDVLDGESRGSTEYTDDDRQLLRDRSTETRKGTREKESDRLLGESGRPIQPRESNRTKDNPSNHTTIEQDGQLSFSFLLPLEDDQAIENHTQKEESIKALQEEKVITYMDASGVDYFSAQSVMVSDKIRTLCEAKGFENTDLSIPHIEEIAKMIYEYPLSDDEIAILINPNLPIFKVRSLKEDLWIYSQNPSDERIENIKFMAEFDVSGFNLPKMEYWELYKNAIINQDITKEQLLEMESNLRPLSFDEHIQTIEKLSSKKKNVKIAIGVGYEIVIIPKVDVSANIELISKDQSIKIENDLYKLYKGATFNDSQKIEKYYFDNDKYSQYRLSEVEIVSKEVIVEERVLVSNDNEEKTVEEYWIVEFNETLEDYVKSYKNELVTPSLIKEIKLLDKYIQGNNEIYNRYGSGEYLGYFKFYFDHYVNGVCVEHQRCDIGDGNEINQEFYEYLEGQHHETEISQEKEKIQETSFESQAVENNEEMERYLQNLFVGRNGFYIQEKKEILVNFHITEEVIPEKLSPMERLQNNLEAISVLKQLENEETDLDETAQKSLARYVGWGGLADVFDESKDGKWKEAREILKEELSVSEYEKAKESTLTAFYTPKIIIEQMYAAIDKLGFKSGRILEPSLGIGHFIGNLPQKLQDSKVSGFELDEISGRIAKLLYPESQIHIQGYEESQYKDEFFDLAIGNIPFGNFKVNDRRYNHHEFLIHDYFFAKTIDQVRTGGLIAFITSSGTLDKNNSEVRRYIGKKCEFLGAIRLPNSAFWSVAGTRVTSDIIFLKKREKEVQLDESWYFLGMDENGFVYNQYFVEHPEMVLGIMEEKTNAYGKKIVVCSEDKEKDLGLQLKEAIRNFSNVYEVNPMKNEVKSFEIPTEVVDGNKYSFVEVGDKVYFKEEQDYLDQEYNENDTLLIKNYIQLKSALKEVIRTQLEEIDEEIISKARQTLQSVYENFVIQHGRFNQKNITRKLRIDAIFPLVSTLEIYEDGQFIGLSDIFTKRTISKAQPITEVQTPEEALILSISTLGRVDFSYIQSLLNPPMSKEEIIQALKGQIFLNVSSDEISSYKNPYTDSLEDETIIYLTSDEYLSGNIRQKIENIDEWLRKNPDMLEVDKNLLEYQRHKLTEVLPERIPASDISVILGSTWIPTSDIKDFVIELLQPDYWTKKNIEVQFTSFNGSWKIEGQRYDRGNDLAELTYGTHRVSAYKLIEDALNFRETRVWDSFESEAGEKVRVLNKKETMLANQKKDMLKEAFREWIFKDRDRRNRLEELYNVRFNSIANRNYDGGHLKFDGMNPEIRLRPHQKDAIARCLFGGNSLLAHVVGAGKTFEMIATAMESKRLGLSNKALFVVPNHLTEQWGKDFYRLYPGANVLVATKKDFEPQKRKKLISRIATGDYDAIVIGHSQFEKIPMSKAYQVEHLEAELNEIIEFIEEYKRDRDMNFTVKEMEKTKKQLERKLEKLNDDFKKDDVISFEELGVDKLFIDEAHYYKNLFLYTKMRNVSGLSQSEAMKSSDLYMKCRYLDSLTHGKGIVFATGTPLSNSMTELYTMQRYLQFDTLKEQGLHHFDAWASTFGETTTSVEIAPEGGTYRLKTRFAKFYNLPELMALFKEIADIKTSDMIHLDVPIAHYENIITKPTKEQVELLETFVERAEAIRNQSVDMSEDNFLKLTTDGKKLAIDQRLLDFSLPDDPSSKVNTCIHKIYEIWETTQKEKKTQLVFSDSSTPKGDGSFNIYDDMKQKLIGLGIPEDEIAFIHDATTESQKDTLFAKVRKGKVRILFGSTAKMGAGTNVQDKLIAIHDVDVPWRPADLEQRAGRIIRQGNENKEVYIYRYITEDTFDGYLWQMIENKQRFVSQIMTSQTPMRSADDVDAIMLNYMSTKAVCTSDPYLKERMNLEMDIMKLKLLEQNHKSNLYRLEDKVNKIYPERIEVLEKTIQYSTVDIQKIIPKEEDIFPGIEFDGQLILDRKDAREILHHRINQTKSKEPVNVGTYRGFDIIITYYPFSETKTISIKGEGVYTSEVSDSPIGHISRLDHLIDIRIKSTLEGAKAELESTKSKLSIAKEEMKKPFEKAAALKTKLARLSYLNQDIHDELIESELMDKKIKAAFVSFIERGNVLVDEDMKENMEQERFFGALGCTSINHMSFFMELNLDKNELITFVNEQPCQEEVLSYKGEDKEKLLEVLNLLDENFERLMGEQFHFESIYFQDREMNVSQASLLLGNRDIEL